MSGYMKLKGFTITCDVCKEECELEWCPSGSVWIDCTCGNEWNND